MLPTKSRVGKQEFPKIMKKGLFFHSRNFYIILLDRGDGLPPRLSFVVPNKVKKSSVGRHLIKRRVSAVAEELLKSIRTAVSGVLFVKKDVSDISAKDIEKETKELFKSVL